MSNILLARDTEGKVTLVYILTIGGYGLVPINLQNHEIGWESIDYLSTRNSIKSAWDNWVEGKNLAFELRARPDLAIPEPELQPD